MSNQLFKNFPEIQYTLSTGKIVTIKDFFRKSMIEQEAVNSVISYTYYEIQDGERPDVVADRLYGCLLYTSPSPRDKRQSRMPSSA